MHSRRSQPTLLVFTLGADREVDRRPLLPAPLRAREVELRRAWLAATLDIGRQLGCCLEVSTPAPLALGGDVRHRSQVGHDFGSRFAAAFAAALETSSGPVVAVGADSPAFGAGHLRRALALLASRPDRVVLGPSRDGGVYLIATATPVPGLAEEVRWCRRDTSRSLRQALEALGREVVELDPLHDVDGPADLQRWLGSRHFVADLAPLAVTLRRLLARWIRPACPRRLGRPLQAPVAFSLARAPPIPASASATI
ncbi:MAG: DUF2064 domain-containing protein [Acidobacteriota bacterium]